MDNYVKCTITYETLKTASPNQFLSLSELENTIESFEGEGAVSSLVHTIADDSACYQSRIHGVVAVMRNSLFEKMQDELQDTYGSIEVNVVPVHFVIQSGDYHDTTDLAALLSNKGITVNGYWTHDSPKQCNNCHEPQKTYHELAEMNAELRKFWDLYCLTENTSTFEELFGAELQPFKVGRLYSPQIKFGITKGPKLPPDLKEHIASITLSKPYSI